MPGFHVPPGVVVFLDKETRMVRKWGSAKRRKTSAKRFTIRLAAKFTSAFSAHVFFGQTKTVTPIIKLNLRKNLTLVRWWPRIWKTWFWMWKTMTGNATQNARVQMLKSCRWCGRIHGYDFVCPKKAIRKQKYKSKEKPRLCFVTPQNGYYPKFAKNRTNSKFYEIFLQK